MERLNKFLAHAGIDSRRHCDELIAAGRVRVNGETVTQAGAKIDPTKDKVHVDDSIVKAEMKVYYVVNKPPGYLCTNNDPAGRPLATDLIPNVDQRVYTVGRLDESSEGMLLLTNDGDLAHRLMHPRHGIEKTYEVLVAGDPNNADLQKLLDGIWISDGKVKAKSVKRINRKVSFNGSWLRIVLCEGKNREIRRMLANLEHKVLRLKRIAIGPIGLNLLPRGESRRLALAEVKLLLESVSHAARKKPDSTKVETVEDTDGGDDDE